jgi:hypothetical protein
MKRAAQVAAGRRCSLSTKKIAGITRTVNRVDELRPNRDRQTLEERLEQDRLQPHVEAESRELFEPAKFCAIAAHLIRMEQIDLRHTDDFRACQNCRSASCKSSRRVRQRGRGGFCVASTVPSNGKTRDLTSTATTTASSDVSPNNVKR